MRTLQDRISDRLREEVCKVCIYQTADGGCDLEKHALECPILTRVDRIIEVVRKIDSERMEPYIAQLRQHICVNCEMQDDLGHCKMRDHADCALDDYFGLIVQIVEEEMQHESA